jgi:DNA replication protein DnaC
VVTIRDAIPSLRLAEPETRRCSCGREFTTVWRWQRGCPECVEGQHRLTAEQLRDERIARRGDLLRLAGLEGRLSEMRLDAFQSRYQPEAHAAAVQHVRNWPNSSNLMFLGQPGTGKTHLAAGIVLALLEQGTCGRYVHLPGLYSALKRAADRREAEAALLDPLFEAPLVVLDDAGREKATEHMAEWLDVLIDSRWNHRQPTIVAANLDENGLAMAIGTASYSRLKGAGRVVVMRGGNPAEVDMRGRKLAAPALPKPIGNPTVACPACMGAGWVVDERVALGRSERTVICQACNGQGW